MTEKWQAYLAKSEQNIEAATLLFDKGMYGLAAYHAQQSLELSIKACVYRFGFDEYLRLKRITELDFVLEGEKRTPLYKHNPSAVLLRASYKFCHDEIERLKARGRVEPSLLPVMEEILDAARQIRNLMDKMDEKKQVALEIWGRSLGLGPKNEETERLLAGIKKASDNRVVERFIESSMVYMYGKLQWLINTANRTRQSHKIQTVIIPTARQLLETAGLPKTFAAALFSGDRESYQREINSSISEKGAWNTLNLIFKPDGLFDEAAKFLESETARVDKVELPLSDLRNYFIWISYIVVMSYPMMLIYSHEEFGRYPTEIDGGRSTEAIYAERRDELKMRINECHEACKIIKGLILDEEIL